MIRYTVVTPERLPYYQETLAQFEREFTYLLGGHRCQVTHGADYGAFFRSLGDFALVLVQDDIQIIGTLAFVDKSISWQSHGYGALYLGDLKIKKRYQNTGLSTLLYRKTYELLSNDAFSHTRELAYFIALQTPHGGDFTLKKRSISPLRLFSVLTSLKLYRVTPEQLVSLEKKSRSFEGTRTNRRNDRLDGQHFDHQDSFLNLSPAPSPLLVDMMGKKDFTPSASFEPLKLVHIAFGTATGTELLEKLHEAGKQAAHLGYQFCCFALDTQRTELIQFLASRGIQTNVTGKIYGSFSTFHLEPGSYTTAFGTYQL